MSVTTVVQETVVDSVGSVVLSPITQDPQSGLWLRTISVYAPPDTNNNIALQFTLQVKGATQASVELTAPAAVMISAPSASL